MNLSINKEQAIEFLLTEPYKLGHMVGFTKLTEMHNRWILDMVCGKEDMTLQAHRGSYKTTCVSIALSILIILFPRQKILFMRKTDNDIKEIVKQVQKILQDPHTQYFVNVIYGVKLEFVVANSSEISTNICTDIRGTAQLMGLGLGGSLTGKHFDRIFTDDIVNVNDRLSKAERDHTKQIYQELQNLKNKGGRIFNTGTPWHTEDAFTLMPNPVKYDCYSTGLFTQDELDSIRSKMSSSLFAANYELRHIAAEDVLFTNPKTGANPSKVEQGDMHIDAAYGGEDYTAMTIVRKEGETYYVLGRLWHKHIDDVEDEIIGIRQQYNAGRIFCEDNADKGYLAKQLRKKGERVVTYHEGMNKYLKISSYLKAEWENIIFVDGTDKAYIDQVCDYYEEAEHDDAPDSLASMVRRLWRKGSQQPDMGNLIFM